MKSSRKEKCFPLYRKNEIFLSCLVPVNNMPFHNIAKYCVFKEGMRIYHAVEEVQREVTFRKLLVHTSKGRSSIVILLFLRIKALEKNAF